jgi:hypothetical protein
MWKYFAVAAIALIVGAVVSPFIIRHLASSTFYNSSVELMEAWSSEGKDWTEFSRFIEAGGRAYWSAEVVFNGLEKGMDEEDIRRALGPPDAVLIGKAEISSSFKLGVQVQVGPIPSDRLRPLDYIPYLEKETAGLYVYKMGRIARNSSHIEQTVMYLEFSAHGKLTRARIIPVSPSNPIGDFTLDTRTDRRVRS